LPIPAGPSTTSSDPEPADRVLDRRADAADLGFALDESDALRCPPQHATDDTNSRHL
jgi:hypothetical protein